MTTRILKVKEMTATKEFKCWWCHKTIKPGDKYVGVSAIPEDTRIFTYATQCKGCHDNMY